MDILDIESMGTRLTADPDGSADCPFLEDGPHWLTALTVRAVRAPLNRPKTAAGQTLHGA
jgi:hypothetical protein